MGPKEFGRQTYTADCGRDNASEGNLSQLAQSNSFVPSKLSNQAELGSSGPSIVIRLRCPWTWSSSRLSSPSFPWLRAAIGCGSCSAQGLRLDGRDATVLMDSLARTPEPSWRHRLYGRLLFLRSHKLRSNSLACHTSHTDCSSACERGNLSTSTIGN